ncbi:decaprenyl-phosphate phosphoribosyltransferase [Desulfothermus sp.]
MLSWIRLIRLKHWVKNFLVFAPAFFAGKMTNHSVLTLNSLCFMAFCFGASGLYIINDICDLKHDRLHPQKKNRPLTSGEIGLKPALVVALVFFIWSITIAVIISPGFTYILLVYICLNLIYSFGLKHIGLLDVFCVSIGYLLRIIAGGIATDISVSPWLFMSAFLLALFITFGKRLNEIRVLKIIAPASRPSLNHYDEEYLMVCLSMAGGAALVMYALYTVEKGGNLIYTLIPAVYGIFRYLQLILKGKKGEPLEVFSDDVQLWLVSWLFLVQIVWAIYGRPR